MYRFEKLGYGLVLVLACCLSPGCGKSAEKKEGPASKPAESAPWQEVKAEDGSFSASFPGAPITQFRQNDEGKQVLCGFNQSDGVTYTIIMTQVNEAPTGLDARARLKSLVARAPVSYGADAKLESSRLDLKVEGNPAAEYSLSFTTKGTRLKLRCRLFFAHHGHQLYQLIAAGPQGAPQAEKFLGGLKLGKYTPGKQVAEPSSTPAPTASPSAAAQH